MRISGVYAIVQRSSGHVYVGSSRDVFRRWRDHVRCLSSGRHHSPALLDAWLLDGMEAFWFVVLEQCPLDDLAIREQAWLDSFEHLLNASHTVKPHPTLVSAAKISRALRGRTLSDTHREKIRQGLLGHPVSPEARAHMSAALRPKRAILPETRLKMIASRHRNGWVPSAEHRAKVSAANLGRIHTPDTRAKVSAAVRAAWIGRLRKPASPEARAKMSASMRAVWQQRRCRAEAEP